MVATVKIMRWTGDSGSPTKTDITAGTTEGEANTVANACDTHQQTALGSANPIRIPPSGTNYSYWVCTRLSADVSPATKIDNIRWYTDGANNFGTGVGAVAASASTYVQASGTPGVTGLTLNDSNYSTLDVGTDGLPEDAFSFTSASPLSVNGEINNPDTGDFGDFVVYQLTIDDTAEAGATGQETFVWLYDES